MRNRMRNRRYSKREGGGADRVWSTGGGGQKEEMDSSKQKRRCEKKGKFNDVNEKMENKEEE
jgi:hypothetical protein